MSELTDIEAAGVKAIRYLQQLAGQAETNEQALIGWRAMDAGQQQFTLNLATMVALIKTIDPEAGMQIEAEIRKPTKESSDGMSLSE